MENEYLELLKRVLVDYNRIGVPDFIPITTFKDNFRGNVLKMLFFLLSKRNIYLSTKIDLAEIAEKRKIGKDWGQKAEYMIGLKRMDNIQFCAENILKDRIEGDFIETGVWRGELQFL